MQWEQGEIWVNESYVEMLQPTNYSLRSYNRSIIHWNATAIINQSYIEIHFMKEGP